MPELGPFNVTLKYLSINTNSIEVLHGHVTKLKILITNLKSNKYFLKA
jgi:hypothetical protein